MRLDFFGIFHVNHACDRSSMTFFYKTDENKSQYSKYRRETRNGLKNIS